jgi:hypothetical protein
MGLPLPMQTNLNYWCVWLIDDTEIEKLVKAGVVPKHDTPGHALALQAFRKGVAGESHYFCYVDKKRQRMFSNFSAIVSARYPQHKFWLQPAADIRSLALRRKYLEFLALYKLRPEDLGGRDVSEFVPSEVTAIANMDQVVAALPLQ